MRLGTGVGIGVVALERRGEGGLPVDIVESSVVVTPNPFATDSSGAVAIELRDIVGDPIADRAFTLAPRIAVVDLTESLVNVDNPNHPADGATPNPVTIQLFKTERDALGELVAAPGFLASRVVVKLNGSTTGVTQPTGVTNASGAFDSPGSVVSSVAGANVVTMEIDGEENVDTAVFEGDGEEGGSTPGTPYFVDGFDGPALNPAGGTTYDDLKNVSAVNFDGRDCIELRYLDGEPGSPNAELRMDYGRNLTHWGVRFQFHVPGNFVHPNVAPSNNKMMQSWRLVYSDVAGGTHQFGLEYQRAGAQASNIRVMARRSNVNSVTSSNPEGDFNVTGQNARFIDLLLACIIGEWNDVYWECKLASASGASDGIFRGWVNGVKIFEITDGKFWNYETGSTPVDCFHRKFYLMGSANALFTEATTFHIDDLELYEGDPGFNV